MEWKTLYTQFETQLEDFWGRRENKPIADREFQIFGRTVIMSSNLPGVLASTDYVKDLYSKAPQVDLSPFQIEIVVCRQKPDPGNLPDNLFEHILYSGSGSWLIIQLGGWGCCHVDLEAGRAVAVLDPELARQPALLARYLLNTIVTNFFIAGGYGFLHATALVKDRRVLLLMAPHNTGKSTTALRLVMAGHVLLSDSMIFIGGKGADLELLGFPVGRFKLRKDMVDHFPEVAPLLEDEPIRGEIKYGADLRRLDPKAVEESMVRPAAITLCLLAQSGKPGSIVRSASTDEVMEAVMLNSLFFDTARVWGQNLGRIRYLVEQAHCCHFLVGTEPDGIVSAASAL